MNETSEIFTKRERLVMGVLYRRGCATAREVMNELPGHPAYSTVRTQLRVLERKGYVRHEDVGRVYVFAPVRPRDQAQRDALRQVIDTFFGGSAHEAVAVLTSQAFRLTQPRPTRRTRGVLRRCS